MADTEESRRTARPKTGGPNPGQLKRAQAKYKQYTKEANTEYERLLAIDKKNKLTVTVNPVEHAFFCHLCELRECKF